MRFVGHGIVSGFHGSIILVSLVFQGWWLAIVISGFNFIGNWLGYFVCANAPGLCPARHIQDRGAGLGLGDGSLADYLPENDTI